MRTLLWRRALGTLVALALLVGLAPGAFAGHESGPAYPSAEWYEREARNFATVSQAPAEQVSDPAFMQRWIEQTHENRTYYMDRFYVKRDWPWNSSGNACNHWSGPCTGNPYDYPGVDPFYDNEGDVKEVIYFDYEGALLSGRVWAPKDAQPGDELPGVVIETGSVQAPETLYWWFAQSLVRAGYVVMTYDVRGQGRSDNSAPNGSRGTNLNSNVFALDLVDSIELFLSTPDNPYKHVVSRQLPAGSELTTHNPFWELVDQDRLGIVGHSLGASGVSVVQGMNPWPGRILAENPVDVAVAWDNLTATAELGGQRVKPRVPTMGQAGDYYLAPTPYTQPPQEDGMGKSAGYLAWKNAGVPTYQVNIRGGSHYEWSLLPSFPTSSWKWGNPLIDHYTLAWLDRWLKEPDETGYDTADARLLDDAAWRDRMSFYFNSSRWYPSRNGALQDCTDIKTGCVIAEPETEPVATSLSLRVEGHGPNRVLIATLTDESGAPLEGKEITFYADGNAIGTATTNSAGEASAKAPKPYHSGHHTYRAEYRGDEGTAPSGAETQS